MQPSLIAIGANLWLLGYAATLTGEPHEQPKRHSQTPKNTYAQRMGNS